MKLILLSLVFMCVVNSNLSSQIIDDCDSCWKSVGGLDSGRHMRANFICTGTNWMLKPVELFGRYETFQCASIDLFKSEVIRIIITITESCGVSDIPIEIFNSFGNLNDLTIILPTLKSLVPWTDFESTKLKSFAVRGKNLPELPANLFANSPQLQNFTAMNTHFDRIDPEAFRKVSNMEQLRIADASLTTLPRDLLKGLANLKTMNLSGNSFTTVDVLDFSDCKNIHTLDLQRNKITELTEQSLNGIAGFSHLLLSGNQISRIAPKTFLKMQNLHKLTLAHNKLDRLSKDMFDGLKNLETLDLCHCSIQQIDGDTFSVMNNLGKLNLSGNSIATLDAHTFNGLNALRILDLSFNKLQEFNMFYTLSELTFLNLSNNNIVQFIGDGIDTNTPMQLKKLDLSYNPITSLKPGLFDGLGNLIWLELAHCQLTSFDFGLLSHTTNVTVLNLSSKTLSIFIVPDLLPFYEVWKELYLDSEQANTLPTKLKTDRKKFPNLYYYLNLIPSGNFYHWAKGCADGWDI